MTSWISASMTTWWWVEDREVNDRSTSRDVPGARRLGGRAAPRECRKRQGAGASTAPGATTAGRYCTST